MKLKADIMRDEGPIGMSLTIDRARALIDAFGFRKFTEARDLARTKRAAVQIAELIERID